MYTTVRSTANSICAVPKPLPYKNSYVVAQPWTSRYDQQPTASVLYHIKTKKQQLYFCCRSDVDTTVRSTANIIGAVSYKNSNYISVVAQTWTPQYDQQPTASVLYHIQTAIIFLLSLSRGHHGTINSQHIFHPIPSWFRTRCRWFGCSATFSHI